MADLKDYSGEFKPDLKITDFSKSMMGKYAVEMGKFYSRLFDTRLESDYADMVFLDPIEIKNDIKTAENFVQTIASVIQRQK